MGRSWEANLGPLQEQYAFSIAEPSSLAQGFREQSLMAQKAWWSSQQQELVVETLPIQQT